MINGMAGEVTSRSLAVMDFVEKPAAVREETAESLGPNQQAQRQFFQPDNQNARLPALAPLLLSAPPALTLGHRLCTHSSLTRLLCIIPH